MSCVAACVRHVTCSKLEHIAGWHAGLDLKLHNLKVQIT
jgi:hypothetical protein